MKKLILAIAMALSFVLPVFTGNIFAAEAKVSVDKELASALKYWTENSSASICKAFALTSQKEVPLEKQKLIEKHVADFGAKTLLPFLKRNNLTAEWIKYQNDPEIRALNTKSLQVKNMQEAQALMVSNIQLLQKKYPNLIIKIQQDQDHVKGFQALTMKVQQVLLAK